MIYQIVYSTIKFPEKSILRLMDLKETTRQRGSQNQNWEIFNHFLRTDSVLGFRHFAQNGFFHFQLDQPY